MTRQQLDDWIDGLGMSDEEIMVPDGLEHCVVGLVERACSRPFLVFDREQVIRTLMTRDGMSEDDAVEFYDFNIACAWVGEGTPGYLVRAHPVRERRV